MTTNRVGILNISIRIAALLFFCISGDAFRFLTHDFVLPFLCGIKSALRSSEFDMYSNGKNPHDVTYQQVGCLRFVRASD